MADSRDDEERPRGIFSSVWDVLKGLDKARSSGLTEGIAEMLVGGALGASGAVYGPYNQNATPFWANRAAVHQQRQLAQLGATLGMNPQQQQLLSAGAAPGDVYKLTTPSFAINSRLGVVETPPPTQGGTPFIVPGTAPPAVPKYLSSANAIRTAYLMNPNDPQNQAAMQALQQTEAGASERALAHAPVMWRQSTDEKGRPIQIPFQKGPDGKVRPIPIEDMGPSIPGKLGAAEQKLITSVETIEQQLPSVLNMMETLSKASTGDLMSQYVKYWVPFGLFGTADPQWTAYFNATGQIQTDLILAASGGYRSFQLIKYLKPHIPDPTDPPRRAFEKLRGFEMGRFQALKATLLSGVTAPAPAPTAVGGSGEVLDLDSLGTPERQRTPTP